MSENDWGPSLMQAASILGAATSPDQFLQLALSSLGVGLHDDLEPIAAPATPLAQPVQRGDVMLRSVPGCGRVHPAVVLAAAETVESLRARGVAVESAGEGTYVEVIEVPFAGGAPRVVGRRLTDAWGRVPRYEAIVRASPAAAWREAAPDQSEQTVDQIDWCRMRQTLVANARTEEARWTDPLGTKLRENEASQRPFLVSYWMTVPGFTAAAAAGTQAAQSAADAEGAEWSAAFICFVMHASGIRAAHGFRFGQRHIIYIVDALRNRERSDRNRPFWLVDSVELQNEATPQPGDLLCFNRLDSHDVMTTHSYHSLRQAWWDTHRGDSPTGSSHCALIVGTVERGGQRFVETIGGNETVPGGGGHESVRATATIPLEANGGISAATAAAHHIFGLIKITRC